MTHSRELASWYTTTAASILQIPCSRAKSKELFHSSPALNPSTTKQATLTYFPAAQEVKSIINLPRQLSADNSCPSSHVTGVPYLCLRISQATPLKALKELPRTVEQTLQNCSRKNSHFQTGIAFPHLPSILIHILYFFLTILAASDKHFLPFFKLLFFLLMER